jgi:aspartate carbamoyltransferase catalytic subunit
MGQVQLGEAPQHILDINSLGKSEIERIISTKSGEKSLKSSNVGLLFFEDSTRTRLSFELAALKAGYNVLNPNLQTSSLQKGETALDTVITLAAMGVDQLVVRSAENGFAAAAAKAVGNQCRIINAGDGTNQHPTQALTDLYILKKHCQGDWGRLRIGIVGNLSHSRVANSLIDGLTLMGVGGLHLIAPDAWQPKNKPDVAQTFDSLETGLRNLNALVVLRAQWERMPDRDKGQIQSLQQAFTITKKQLDWMQTDAIIMHPGPVLRDQEIATELLTDPRVKINAQVAAGVAIREALLTKK